MNFEHWNLSLSRRRRPGWRLKEPSHFEFRASNFEFFRLFDEQGGFTHDYFTVIYDDTQIRLLYFKNGQILGLIWAGLPEGIVRDGRVIEPEKLAKILSELKVKSKPKKITAKGVVFVVPESKVLLKIVELPNVQVAEIPGALRWQIEKILSVPPGRIYFDWREVTQKNKKIKKVLVTSCERMVADSLVTTAKLAGLEVLSIISRSGALAGLVADTPHVLFLLLDCSNPQEFAAIVVKNRVARLSTVFTPNQDKSIAENIRETMEYYRLRKEPGRRFGIIYIFGAEDPDDVQAQLAELHQPIKILHFSQFTSVLKDNPGLDAFLINLGFYFTPLETGINLLPPGEKEEIGWQYISRTWQKLERAFLIILLIFFAGFALSWLGLFVSQRTLENKLQTARSAGEDPALAEVQKKVIDLNRVLDQVSQLQGKNSKTAEIMEKIQTALPGGIGIDKLEYEVKTNNLTISGLAQNRDSILAFKDNLTASKIGQVEVPLKNFESAADIQYEIVVKVGQVAEQKTNESH